MTTRADDPQYITESDIDVRIEYGYVVTDDELMTAEEWWENRAANHCCDRSNWYCPCGGPEADPESYLLRREPDEIF